MSVNRFVRTAVKRGLVALAVSLVLVASSPSGAVGVRPLVLDLDMRPGEAAEFELILSSPRRPETLNLTMFEARQSQDGSLNYAPADSARFPAAHWVTLEAQRVVVRPGEEVPVRGRVQVPYDAGGSYIVVVMVEPETPLSTGVAIRVRYAVRLHIRVQRVGLRPAAELLRFELVPDEHKAPILSMHMRNPSRLLYDVSAQVTIRDDTRRLVERVTLHTAASAPTGADTTQIYPGADVVFTGAVQQPLYPGEYEVRLFMRYADGRQLVKTRQIVIREDEFQTTGRTRPLAVFPERIEAELHPGAVAARPIQLRNDDPLPLWAHVRGRPIAPGYSRSVFDAMDVQVRGDAVVEVESRRTGRTVLVLQAPKDVDVGGYYGYIDVDVFRGDEHIDTVSVPMEVTVPGAWEPRATVLDVAYASNGQRTLFSVEVHNFSPVHIAPTGVIYLHDNDGVVVDTLSLRPEEDVVHILPDRSGLLLAEADQIAPGRYTAEVHVRYNGRTLDMADIPILIETTGGNGP